MAAHNLDVTARTGATQGSCTLSCDSVVHCGDAWCCVVSYTQCILELVGPHSCVVLLIFNKSSL
jgi:hypothetical protein